MNKWLQWIILSGITGSPVGSAVFLLVFYWAVDRFTFRLLPDPVAFVRRSLRAGNLRRELINNPHDRRARYELAELMVGRRRYARAVELLKPNLEAGDDDVPTLYLMGVACLGAGHHQQGEALLDEAAKEDAGFRLGAIELERGRWRLKRGDARGAVEALRKLLAFRKGTIEGRFLLARALEAAGDDGAGALMREEAWREYVGSPRFHRRAERLWAWRARPSRPLLYAAIALACVVLLGRFAGPQLTMAAQQMASEVASEAAAGEP
jgi:tetratricopeptide (TPR) repeat protein